VVAVVEQADQRRQAERTSHQHGFVMVLIRVLADRHEIGHRGVEFLLSEPHLAGEFVQMTDQGGQDFPRTRIFGARIGAKHRLGNVLLVFDNHTRAPQIRRRPFRWRDFT